MVFQEPVIIRFGRLDGVKSELLELAVMLKSLKPSRPSLASRRCVVVGSVPQFLVDNVVGGRGPFLLDQTLHGFPPASVILCLPLSLLNRF